MDLISGLRKVAADGPTHAVSYDVVAAFSLEGRTAVVTGAASDIGRETGIIRSSLIVDTTEDNLDAVLPVNLKGLFWGTAVAGRVMSAAKRGSIVNVASSGGETGVPTLSMYGMAKAGVIQLIAWSMLYLASEASRFITGQVLRPNGGVHMA